MSLLSVALPTFWLWIGFTACVVALLALDLGVFHRERRAMSLREAIGWSMAWIALALAFNFLIYVWRGPESAIEFLTGYLLEKSLSVDNFFVIALIFAAFRTPAAYQHQILFWGILGALVMRGTMIVVGATLLEQFGWVAYVFGAFLIVTGMKMAAQRESSVNPEESKLLRLIGRVLPTTSSHHAGKFVAVEGGRVAATPLLLALFVVESTDVAFAVDSIPAVFGVTRDAFIVYTSNVFAILGLRSLYFVLAGVMDKFHYLKLALGVVLISIGARMLLEDVRHIPVAWSLGFTVVVLAVAAIASVVRARRASLVTDVPV